jgi:hypothetical protein
MKFVVFFLAIAVAVVLCLRSPASAGKTIHDAVPVVAEVEVQARSMPGRAIEKTRHVVEQVRRQQTERTADE